MKAVILAGGISRRFLIGDKPSTRFLGKNLVEYHAEILEKYVDEIAVVCNPRNCKYFERFKRYLQEEPRGILDAVLRAKEFLDSPFILVNSNDIVSEEAYKILFKRIEENPEVGYVLGYKVKKYFPGGYLVLDGDRIREIIEKPGEGREPSDLVNILIHYHPDPKIFEKNKLEYEEFLTKILKEHEYRVVMYDGPWYPIKYPFHLLDAMEFFLGRMEGRSLRVKKNLLVENSVLKEGVVITCGRIVIRNSYIGGCVKIVGDCVIENSHINRDCKIVSSRISNCYIYEDCRIEQSEIEFSVIGRGSKVSRSRFLGRSRKEVVLEILGERVKTGRKNLGVIVGENKEIKDAELGPGEVIL